MTKQLSATESLELPTQNVPILRTASGTSKNMAWGPFLAVAILLFSADAARHAFTLAIGPSPLCLDARQYWEMGGLVAQGDLQLVNMPIDYRTPGYGWFIGFFRLVFDQRGLLALVLAQHILVFATSVLTGLICWILTERRWAFLIGYGLSILCVTRAWHANVILAATLFTFAFTAVLLAATIYSRRATLMNSVWLALALGFAILVRPVPQLLCVPLVLVMLMNTSALGGQLRFRQACAQALGFVCVLGLVLSPWYVRNQQLFGEWFLTKLPVENKWQVCFQAGSGPNLPLPNIPASAQFLTASGTPELKERYAYAVVAKLQHAGLSADEIDRLVTELCLGAIREHPVAFGYAATKRCVNFWRCVVNEYPSFGTDGPPFYDDQQIWRYDWAARGYEPILRYSAAHYVRLNELMSLCVAAGCASLLMHRKTRVFGLALVLIFAYFTAVTAAVEIENYRYRMVLEPLMIVACVGGLYRTVRFLANTTS